MATIAELEARIEKGDRAMRAREASGTPIPARWYDEYEGLWRELLATWTLTNAPTQDGPLVQAAMPINGGRWG